MTDKRAYIVTTAETDSEGKLMCPTSRFYVDKGESRSALGTFQAMKDQSLTAYIPHYNDHVEGECKIRKVVEDGDDVIASVCTKTGGTYYGHVKKIEIDDNDLQNLTTDYEVMVEVKRTYLITVDVYEAEDEADAEQKAYDQIREGQEESSFDYPDDEELEMSDINEA